MSNTNKIFYVSIQMIITFLNLSLISSASDTANSVLVRRTTFAGLDYCSKGGVKYEHAIVDYTVPNAFNSTKVTRVEYFCYPEIWNKLQKAYPDACGSRQEHTAIFSYGTDKNADQTLNEEETLEVHVQFQCH